MENIAIHVKEAIGLNRGNVVFATIPGDKDLVVVTQGVRARSKTTTVVVTPLEKVDNSSNGKVIYVGKGSYAIQAAKSRVCSKLRLQIDGGYVIIRRPCVQKREGNRGFGFAPGTLLET